MSTIHLDFQKFMNQILEAQLTSRAETFRALQVNPEKLQIQDQFQNSGLQGRPHAPFNADLLVWQKLVAKPRIDLANFDELESWARDMRTRGEKWLVLDLKGTRFMSLPVIRFLENLSEELRRAGGALALEGMPDKTRRIFEIYGSFKNIYLVERSENLRAVRDRVSNPFYQLKNY